MPLINLTHVFAIGSTACQLAAEISRQREGCEAPNDLLNIIPMDSDATTLDELSEALQERFLLMPTDRGIADRAARDPESHLWTHSLNDPRTYEPPRKGLGFHHQPRNCLIALTASARTLSEHAQRWRRQALARLRTEGRDGVQVQERSLILFEPYGATGWGWIVLACQLRLDDPSARIDAMMTLPDPAVADEASLLEYRVKAYDFFATMRAADSGELRLHPELSSFPVDLLLLSNPGRTPEVGSFSDHTSVLTADVMALLDGYAHFETQWINCHQLNLSERIYQAGSDVERPPLRLVPFGAVTYRHDPDAVAEWLEDRVCRALARALSSPSGDHNLRRFLERTLGRFDQVVELQRQRFHRDRDLTDWMGTANKHNVTAKRGQLGPAIQGLQRNGRRELAEILVPRDAILKAIALDASVAVASDDLADSLALVDGVLGNVRSRLEQHEREVGRADEFFARRATVASPNEIQEAFRSRAQAELQADLLRGVGERLEECRDLVVEFKKIASARLGRINQIAGSEPLPLVVPGLGEEPVVTERLLEEACRPLLTVACTQAERCAPLSALFEGNAGARGVLGEHARRYVADLATRSASDWARLRFTTFNQRDCLVREVAGRLNHVDLLPAPGVPAQKHLWVLADGDFSGFRGDLLPHIGGRLNHQGKQPSRTLPSDGRGSRLVFLSVWLGIGPDHLVLNHDERVVQDWRRRRGEGFGFGVTAQEVPQLPKPIIPEPRHVRPPRPMLRTRIEPRNGAIRSEKTRVVQQADDWFVRKCLEELRRIDHVSPRDGKRTIN